MSKNILVLTGSPRKNGNSDMMADAFIKGAKSKGHNITKFETAWKTINGCRACDTCWSKGTACSFKDDFNELEPFLQASDIIVFSTPLYWSHMPSQLKAAIDKLYAYVVDSCKFPLKIKESILMVCGGDKEIKVFNGIIESYKSTVDYMKWEDRGILTITNVHVKGDIIHTTALKEAEKLGMSI